jgi:hypothetical protein
MSYYSFAVAEEASYSISVGSIGSALRYTVSPDYCSYDYWRFTSGTIDLVLPPGTYFLTADNNYYGDAGLPLNPFTLLVRRSGDFPAQGSIASPVPLSAGAAHSASVGGSVFTRANASYYRFTIPSDGNYSIVATGLASSLDFAIYSDSAYTAQVAVASGSSGLPATSLAAGTYYLKVANSSTPTTVAFSMTLQ